MSHRRDTVKFSAYSVPQPFTFHRLLLVEIVVEIVTYSPTEGLEALPLEAWDLFIPWFFEYSHNNIFHCLLFKLLYAAVRCNHTRSLQHILEKHDFLARLIKNYRADPTAGIPHLLARSFREKICRLADLVFQEIAASSS